MKLPESWVQLLYCRYPNLWSACLLQVPKSEGELVYSRYPTLRKSWSNEATQKLGRAIVL